MKIEKPTELADAVAKLDTLEQQLKDFEETKTKLEEANTALAEATNQVTALETENKEIKQQLATSDTARDSFEKAFDEEKAKVAELTATSEAKPEAKVEELDSKTPVIEVNGVDVIAELKSQIEELKGRLDASIEVAADKAEETDAVKEQVALVASQLTPKGQIPDIEEAGSTEKNESYKTWMTLATSKRPEDRRAARQLKKHNPEINSEITKVTAPAAAFSPVKPTVTSEQLAVYSRWQSILKEADVNKKNYKLHAEKVVEARRFYNAEGNRAIIDACLAARA